MIDVIIAAKQYSNMLSRCITSVLRQEEISKVIIVTPDSQMFVKLSNNGYNDEIVNDNLIIVDEPKNFCLAWARRYGVNYTTQELVCYVDDDVILGENYFIPILKKISELEKLYPTYAVEGIMTTYTKGRKPVTYEEKIMEKGDRGFTHNTTIPRQTLLTWKPTYTFAWEDWLLTQHVLSLGGTWIRLKTPIHTKHFHAIGTWRRTAWDVAGERMVKGITTTQFFKRLYQHLRSLCLHILFREPLFRIKDDVDRFRGTLLGYLKGHIWINMKRGVNL